MSINIYLHENEVQTAMNDQYHWKSTQYAQQHDLCSVTQQGA